MENYKIYKHTSPNGKCYIGITKQELTERWRGGDGYRNCTAFYRAIEKYGWDNIEHEVIDRATTLKQANEKERFYISEYKSNDKRYGYNCTDGGDGVSGWKPTEEQRRKNSESKKEMWKNQETRDALTQERRCRGQSEAERERLTRLSRDNWDNAEIRERLLAHLSELNQDKEIKNAHSQKMKSLWKESPETFMQNRKYKTGAENKCSKPVRCIDTGLVYSNAREAERETGVSYKYISACAIKSRNSAKGQRWEFANEQNKRK